ncbi:L,D-transpeptidase [Rhodobacter sp. KR11]|uniref:L,D-transpeptidase n=1 Tax=Rhodobacter sp. KR11 TaxID=2974588 RepID=UPI00222190F3|nr:L,D-transpeptidase [Rhodobacter sp. KR11]MCW1918583.1 L,D-transpeptidase [Rhodobacter sp. KR11]
MTPFSALASKLSAFALLASLAACAPTPKVDVPPPAVAGYEAVVDNGFEIPAVDPALLKDGYQRTGVAYAGEEEPGTIVVDPFARKLYLVEENGMAIRYGVAVGRQGLSFRGNGVIGRTEEWPSWTPTANMVRTRPDLYAEYAGGRSGGLDNPLGARALYLYRGGRDTMFRIHGTMDPASIGHATSAGCIRLFNQDAIDLYERVERGAKIKVRTLEESVAAEGPYMDNAFGRAVPDTPENQEQKLKDEAAIAEAAAADPEFAAKLAAAQEAERRAMLQAAAAGGK